MFKPAHDQLFSWYTVNGRHELPWRQTSDPYAIYISEIMLQQTQVKTVLERFYFPFLEAFPTVEDLANAKLDDVLKKWEGLGYYRRARNMHEAVQKLGGKMPSSVEGLTAMKGVGKSTAHAIASFAYHTPVPILDANVKRILYRIFAKEHASEKELWQLAHDFFDARHPFEFNQAMMDLGSAICTQKPQCELCPIERSCLASDIDPLEFPLKVKRKSVPIKEKYLQVYSQDSRYGLRQNTGEFLHGLWSFPLVEKMKGGRYLGELTQKYSHFHLHVKVYELQQHHEGLTWFSFESLQALALSKLDHKVLAFLGR